MQEASLIIKSSRHNQRGMSLVEVLLAVAIFAVISAGVIGAIIYGQESTAVAGARERAVKIAEEGIEAVRNIRDSGYGNLPADGTYGLVISGGVWTLSGSSDTTDIFTRSINLATIDARTRNITVNVNWNQTAQRTGSISLNTYFTDWVTAPTNYRKGMLVYGDGGNSTDAIKYQIYDDSNGTWSAAAATADVDGLTANKYLRSARLYASPTRNEKILISRHYNGVGQWIYAQVYNGTSWGNVVQLSTWNATTYLDVQNFDGTYLANGDFIATYSDNTTTPKFRVWNGTTWAGAVSMQVTGGVPNYIVTKNRPSTNEAMSAFFDQSSDTNTQYYDGAGYATSDWTLHGEHSAVAPVNTKKLVDFDWSSGTIGALVYSLSASDRRINTKIWTANGSGGGSWGSASNGPNIGPPANRLGALVVSARKNSTNDYVTCSKDSTPTINCYQFNNVPVWTTPTGGYISAATQTGIQQSYDFHHNNAGDMGLIVYSDNTLIAKYKKYNSASNSFDAASGNLGTASGVVSTVRLVPNPASSDGMIITSDAANDCFTVIWDGTNNQLFTTPVGKAWTAHGIQGSATTDYWYDFVWDGM